jgi:gamma-glutamyl-gamma-aminobutyrate hydrolase PuuD
MVVNWNYGQAIAEAGGVPILIPPMADMEAISKIIDGWLIPGGLDIDATRFGETNHPKVELQDPARYDGEAALYRHLDPAVPILGICYGCQFINVVRGGTLTQHLPDVVGHENHSGGTEAKHLLQPSLLAEVTGVREIEGKSYHHQAVSTLGEGLTITSEAEDGTVEALEGTDRPWLIGVQWHPERSLEDPATRRLFDGFIAAARQFAERKHTVLA